jgi:phospholipid/cholesterol/gamma-HCH transport system permease protein
MSVNPQARLRLDLQVSPPVLHLAGEWRQSQGLPDLDSIASQLGQRPSTVLKVDGQAVDRWDTSLAAFLRALRLKLADQKIQLEASNMPKGVDRLMSLIRDGRKQAESKAKLSWLEKLGALGARLTQRVLAWLGLAGMTFAALLRLTTGRARVPISDLTEQLTECGPRALGIVTLLSFLIGGILAFVGVVQLRMFGAEIYMADLVGMGMLLEMGALMTGVILSGRAGAAFAAAIGTMQTNEEVDALQTLGFDPVEFLVMPRVLALTVMAPILTLYANMMGILGGAFVAWSMLDISLATFFTQVSSAVHLSDAIKGLLKAIAFGALISFAGCLRGIECGRSAQAVGQATTSAVVTSIVLIVIADAFLTVLYFVYDGLL